MKMGAGAGGKDTAEKPGHENQSEKESRNENPAFLSIGKILYGFLTATGKLITAGKSKEDMPVKENLNSLSIALISDFSHYKSGCEGV